MRMLSKLIVAGTVFAAMTPAYAAEDAGKHRFAHEGQTYVYQVKEVNGVKQISGRRYPDATAFNLSVRNGRVFGRSGAQIVAFNVEDARGAAAE